MTMSNLSDIPFFETKEEPIEIEGVSPQYVAGFLDGEGCVNKRMHELNGRRP
jgi:hypothetical protein